MEKYQVLIDIAILLVAILAYALCIRLYFKAKKKCILDPSVFH